MGMVEVREGKEKEERRRFGRVGRLVNVSLLDVGVG